MEDKTDEIIEHLKKAIAAHERGIALFGGNDFSVIPTNQEKQIMEYCAECSRNFEALRERLDSVYKAVYQTFRKGGNETDCRIGKNHWCFGLIEFARARLNDLQKTYAQDRMRADEALFPYIVTSLPRAEISIEGAEAHLLQGEHQQILFMSFSNDATIPEHAHAAQWGTVLGGRMELIVDGKKRALKKGNSYFIPEGVPHAAVIHAGYKDVTLFDQKDRYRRKLFSSPAGCRPATSS